MILSRESFSGGMPGHRKLGGAVMTSYIKPATALASVIISELRKRFGQDTEITFFYTTRQRESWIRSVHGHLLRSIELTDDLAQFQVRFSTLDSPAEQAAAIGRAADGVVVGSAIVSAIADSLNDGQATDTTVSSALDIVSSIAEGVRSARD